MGSSIERDTQRRRAQLGVVGRQSLVSDAPHGDRVDAGRVAVAVAVVVREAAVPGRPDVDVPFASPALLNSRHRKQCLALRPRFKRKFPVTI